MPRKKKTEAPETEEKEVKTRNKAAKVVEPEPEETGDEGGVAKIQCVNRRRKLVCVHLLLDSRKCSVKTIAPGRLASVRIGKKRRCALYEEASSGEKKG